MLAALLTLSETLSPQAAPAPQKAPRRVELFGKEGWYKSQPGKEQEFVGTLEKAPRQGGIGFGRFNPYRLTMKKGDRTEVREVYVGGKPQLLAPQAGKKVKIVGKPVDLEVEGKVHHEIWPAHLFVLE